MSKSNGFQAIEQVKTTLDNLGVRPEPIDFKVVEVSMNPMSSKVFLDYSESLTLNLNASAESFGSSLRVTVDEIRSYLAALLYNRIAYVSRKGNNVIRRAAVTIPSFWVIVLENVGKVSDDTLGITLVPSMEQPLGFSTYQEIDEFSTKLRAFGRFGLSYGDQMPRDTSGSWEFMTCQAIKDRILRHDDKAHPVYALLASTVEMNSLESVITPRVKYGYTEHFRQLVRNFAHVGT